MALLVNLRPTADHAACRAAFEAEGYTVSDCGSGGTCHVFIVDGTATLPQSLLDEIISMVDADATVDLDAVQDTLGDPGLWHLDWIDGSVDGEYAYDSDGTGVPACLIDTPINDTSLIANLTQVHAPFSPGSVTHGTDTASMLAGLYDGVAKNADIFHAHGFNGEGIGTVTDVNAAWTALNDSMEADGRPFVLNCSFSFNSDSFAANVTRTQALGGFIFASAGNSNPNGLDLSTLTRFPSQNAGVFVVGAHDEQGLISYFSNFGTGVDVYAPGEGLTVGAGTSFSSPIAAGIGARALQLGATDPLQWIFDNAIDVSGLLTARAPVWNAPTQIVRLKGITISIDPDGVPRLEVAYPPQSAAIVISPAPDPDPDPDPPSPDPNFDPASLAPTWWLDGSDAATMFTDEARTLPASVNDAVSGVTVKGSHTGEHLIRLNASTAPIWDGDGILLGSSGVMRSASPGAVHQAPHTFAFVAAANWVSGTDHLFDAYGSSRQSFTTNGASFRWYSDASGFDTVAPADSNMHSWLVQVDGANSFVHQDGVEVWAGDLSNGAWGGWHLGTWSGGSGANWLGPLRQMMHINRVLTSQERLDLSSWLMERVNSP